MGAVTMLFSDIEDSTLLVRRLADRWPATLALHRRTCRSAWQRHAGREIATEGDSFFVAFDDPRRAVEAALDAQTALTTTAWPGEIEVRTRIGLHHGEVVHHEQGYVGLEVHRASRICGAARGGQVIASAELVAASGPLRPPIDTVDLGRHHLRGLGSPVHLFQLTRPGLSRSFAPLRDTESHDPEHRDVVTSDEVITVATIDNHEVVREGIAARLQHEPDLEVIASVGAVEEYLAVAGEGAQVVLLDLWLDAGSALPSIPLLVDAGAHVLLCTTEHRPEHLRSAVTAGASGVLLKRDPLSTVITGVRRAADGDFYCSSSMAHALLTQQGATAPSGIQRTILEGLARGLDDASLADGLGITEAQLRRHLSEIRDSFRAAPSGEYPR